MGVIKVYYASRELAEQVATNYVRHGLADRYQVYNSVAMPGYYLIYLS